MKKLYKNYYFKNRLYNDPKRLKTFKIENFFLKKHVTKKEKICDIGCSTGEFLNYLNWEGEKYGMEINKFAIQQAKKLGIKFDKDIFNKRNYFEVIILRGVIQHLDQPFYYIENCYKSLKKNGLLVFLSTPNIGSIYFRFFQNLPALDDKRNFYLPSKKNLINVCKIYDFKFIDYSSYYLKTGYSNIYSDYLNFFLKIIKISKKDNPFPGNMMNLVFKK